MTAVSAAFFKLLPPAKRYRPQVESRNAWSDWHEQAFYEQDQTEHDFLFADKIFQGQRPGNRIDIDNDAAVQERSGRLRGSRYMSEDRSEDPKLIIGGSEYEY